MAAEVLGKKRQSESYFKALIPSQTKQVDSVQKLHIHSITINRATVH